MIVKNITGGGTNRTPSEKKKLTMIELCSGVGMQYRGVQNTPCFEPEVVATSEIDINAIICYAAIHCGMTMEMIENYQYPEMERMRQYLTDLNIGYDPVKDKKYDWFKSGKKFEGQVKKVYLACKLSKNLGDVNRINSLPKADVWFLSFPCQSISVAGKLTGIAEGSGTRSSLVWETIRLLNQAKDDDVLPQYMCLENVKNLVGKKFIDDFERFNGIIDSFGYNVYYKVLNGKNCGVPQNRERVFAIYIRKDIDTKQFEFPAPFDTGIRLKDILEEEVDEKYYINTERAKKLIQRLLDDGVIGNDNPDSRAEQSRAEQSRAIDLSINQPRGIEYANCISARTDRGISNRKAEGCGVCELQQD